MRKVLRTIVRRRKKCRIVIQVAKTKKNNEFFFLILEKEKTLHSLKLGEKKKRNQSQKSYHSKALDVNLTCGKTYLRTFDEELNF